MFCVPASNLFGSGAKVVSCSYTYSIISPPIRKGVILFNNSFFPYRTPIPSGASILCPENIKKSQQSFSTSIFICGILCEASTITIAPFLWAYFIIFSILFIVPNTFETCVILTIFVLSVILLSISSSVISNSLFMYI